MIEDLRLYAEAFFRNNEAPDMPPFPQEAEHVWRWFPDLDRTRHIGMQPNPISYHEIEAYCRLHRIKVSPWEVRALCAIDGAAFAARNKKMKPGENEPTETVAISDADGVNNLMQGMASRLKGKKK